MTTTQPSAPSSLNQPDGNASRRSVGDLLGDVSRDVSALVRQEVELAKAEVREEVKAAGKAGGMFGGAGFAGYMVLLFLSFAAWWGLANAIDQGWAALIVAVIWAAIGAAFYVVARKKMRMVRGIPRTKETLREMPGALKADRGGTR